MPAFSSGRVYVNTLGLEGEERGREAFGATYERLVMLKNPIRGRLGRDGAPRSLLVWPGLSTRIEIGRCFETRCGGGKQCGQAVRLMASGVMAMWPARPRTCARRRKNKVARK
jgi:hypothetical protein